MPNPQRRSRSFFAFLLCAVIIAGTHAYYPKWQMSYDEATISWDVSGYYFYLPAIFIYKDLKKVGFRDEVVSKYKMSNGAYQAYDHESGNRIMKYSAGMALQYLPYFLAGHGAALLLDYPADGFSLPYQVGISLGSLFMAFLGIFFLRKILLRYFDDTTTGITLLLIVAGTNYLNYSAIDGAMTHNWLFTLYTLLIWQSIRFYEQPSNFIALSIGGIVGLMALTRPTEIIACLIPLLWGCKNIKSLIKRVEFFYKFQLWGGYYLLIASIAVISTGSIQLLYWKYVSGQWLVYSYQDQGFSWLTPHIWDGLFSGRAGWLVYTPTMMLALLGFWKLWQMHKELFFAVFSFALIFSYVTFAWDIWWYGGSFSESYGFIELNKA